MPSSAAAGTAVPAWPKISATLDAHGSGELSIDGRVEQLAGVDTAAARAHVLAQVTATAAKLERPVRLTTSDPDGEWDLAVHPDGRVEEFATRSVPKAAPAPGTRRTPSVPRGTPRRSRAALLAAVGALLAVLAAIAVVITTSDDSQSADRAPITPPVSVPAFSPRVDETATAVSLADARRADAQRRAAAKRRAKVAALRRARAARAARLRAAAARRRAASAAAARRAAAAAAPPPAAAAQPPAVRPPPRRVCGEFDFEC